MAVDARRDRAFCSNFGDASVSVIEGKTNQVIATLKVGLVPCAIVVDSQAQRGYVANSLENTVSVLDLEQLRPLAQVKVERC